MIGCSAILSEAELSAGTAPLFTTPDLASIITAYAVSSDGAMTRLAAVPSVDTGKFATRPRMLAALPLFWPSTV